MIKILNIKKIFNCKGLGKINSVKVYKFYCGQDLKTIYECYHKASSTKIELYNTLIDIVDEFKYNKIDIVDYGVFSYNHNFIRLGILGKYDDLVFYVDISPSKNILYIW